MDNTAVMGIDADCRLKLRSSNKHTESASQPERQARISDRLVAFGQRLVVQALVYSNQKSPKVLWPMLHP